MAVQAKREIGRLWEDIGKPPYKQLFNSGVNGPYIWETVQTLRSIDAALRLKEQKFSGRNALVCVHGNRFIQWGTFKRLGLHTGFTFAGVKDSIPETVDLTVAKVIDAVTKLYADLYPASLFKNLSKCRKIATAIM